MKTISGVVLGAMFLLPSAASGDDAKVDRGMAVFSEQKCTMCHSIAERGNKKGALDDVGSRLNAADIRQWIVDPVGTAARTTPPPTRKPAMKKSAIPDADVDALVALLSGLKKK
jgi:hypothetical protein